jgi:hypothetical protein
VTSPDDASGRDDGAPPVDPFALPNVVPSHQDPWSTAAPALPDDGRRPVPPGAAPSVGVVVLDGQGRALGPTTRQASPDLPRRSIDHAEPQPYWRMLRTRSFRGWRPLVGLLLMVGVFAALSAAVTVAFLLPAAVSGDTALDDPLDALFATPSGLLGVNLSLAVLIPAALVALVVAHRIRPGFLASVVGGLRWRYLAVCSGLVLTIMLVSYPVQALLASTDPEQAPVAGAFRGFAEWLPFVLVILITTPLQAAGEEAAFRGYGMQALGSWFRSSRVGLVVTVAVTSLLFAWAHGGQNAALFTDRLLFGVVAAVLTILTGGLEAAIALHVVNNTVLLLIASAFDDLGSTLTVSEAPWSMVFIDIAMMAVFAALALLVARRMGLATRTTPTPAAPAGPPGLVAPAAAG